MKAQPAVLELAIIALLCVLAIFLCPASVGPYSVVHGPVTVFRSIRVFVILQTAMLAAALALCFAARLASRLQRVAAALGIGCPEVLGRGIMRC